MIRTGRVAGYIRGIQGYFEYFSKGNALMSMWSEKLLAVEASNN